MTRKIVKQMEELEKRCTKARCTGGSKYWTCKKCRISDKYEELVGMRLEHSNELNGGRTQ